MYNLLKWELFPIICYSTSIPHYHHTQSCWICIFSSYFLPSLHIIATYTLASSQEFFTIKWWLHSHLHNDHIFQKRGYYNARTISFNSIKWSKRSENVPNQLTSLKALHFHNIPVNIYLQHKCEIFFLYLEFICITLFFQLLFSQKKDPKKYDHFLLSAWFFFCGGV